MVLLIIWPLGKLQNAMLDLQDHFESLVYILAGGKPIPDWLRPAHSPRLRPQKSGSKLAGLFGAIWPAKDASFRTRMTTSTEWTDLDLLFRTLTELKAEPLILSMPIDAFAAEGVSRSAREVYYDRMRELSERYHFPVIEFEQHDADAGFIIARREHPIPRGWMVYDRALDDFFRSSK